MTDINNEKLDIAVLEKRVDELITTLSSLQQENTTLRSQQESLVKERAGLIDKTEKARSRIEAIITRLRAMETRP